MYTKRNIKNAILFNAGDEAGIDRFRPSGEDKIKRLACLGKYNDLTIVENDINVARPAWVFNFDAIGSKIQDIREFILKHFQNYTSFTYGIACTYKIPEEVICELDKDDYSHDIDIGMTLYGIMEFNVPVPISDLQIGMTMLPDGFFNIRCCHTLCTEDSQFDAKKVRNALTGYYGWEGDKDRLPSLSQWEQFGFHNPIITNTENPYRKYFTRIASKLNHNEPIVQFYYNYASYMKKGIKINLAPKRKRDSDDSSDEDSEGDNGNDDSSSDNDKEDEEEENVEPACKKRKLTK